MMITFRLSTLHDRDLIAKVNEIPKQKRARFYRKALRELFFGQNENDVIYPVQFNETPTLRVELSANEKADKSAVNLDDNLDNALNF